MNSVLKTSISLFALAALLAAAPAGAQDAYGGRRGDMVLVTPEGDILDYVPADGSVRVGRDHQGRRVYVDSWGNLIATAMPAERYFSRYDTRDFRRDRYRPVEGYPETSPDYFPPAPDPYGDDLTTGSVPGFRTPGAVDRSDLPDLARRWLSRRSRSAGRLRAGRHGLAPGRIDGAGVRAGTAVSDRDAAWPARPPPK